MSNRDIVRVITPRTGRDLCNDIYILWLCTYVLAWMCHMIRSCYTCALCICAPVEVTTELRISLQRSRPVRNVITRTILWLDTLLPSRYILLIIVMYSHACGDVEHSRY